MKIEKISKQFNWRFLLVRIVVNALALAVTAAILPKIYFVDKSIWNWLLMAIMLGVLNALLKPVLQFLTLQFIFVTYGLVVVVVNALLLWLLAFLFPTRFAVDSLLWLMVAGLVLGLLSSFLESLLGLTMPIVPDEPRELQLQVEQKARQVDWLTSVSGSVTAEEQTLATEPPVPEAYMAKTSIPEFEQGPAPWLDGQAMPSASAGTAEAESAPELQGGNEEDQHEENQDR